MNCTKEICQEIALKYKYRKDFRSNDKNAYCASVNHKWLNDICSHMEKLMISAKYLSKDDCLEYALKCKTTREFTTKYISIYNKCIENNWLNEACLHMKRNKYCNYWTKEKCQEIALKYNHRSDFKDNDASVYRTSLHNKWMDEKFKNIRILFIFRKI